MEDDIDRNFRNLKREIKRISEDSVLTTRQKMKKFYYYWHIYEDMFTGQLVDKECSGDEKKAEAIEECTSVFKNKRNANRDIMNTDMSKKLEDISNNCKNEEKND